MSSEKILRDGIDRSLAGLPLKVKQSKWKINISGQTVVCSVVVEARHRERVKHEAGVDYDGVVDRGKVDVATGECGVKLGNMIRQWALRGGGLDKAVTK